MAVKLTSIAMERIADIIADDVSHIGVGTGAVAPVGGDTSLGEETFRNDVGSRLKEGNKFQLRLVIANANLPTTMKEVGAFMNASAGANSGDILVRATETFSKGASDLLVVITFTVAEASGA